MKNKLQLNLKKTTLVNTQMVIFTAFLLFVPLYYLFVFSLDSQISVFINDNFMHFFNPSLASQWYTKPILIILASGVSSTIATLVFYQKLRFRLILFTCVLLSLSVSLFLVVTGSVWGQ